jgi:hypothetical protein
MAIRFLCLVERTTVHRCLMVAGKDLGNFGSDLGVRSVVAGASGLALTGDVCGSRKIPGNGGFTHSICAMLRWIVNGELGSGVFGASEVGSRMSHRR